MTPRAIRYAEAIAPWHGVTPDDVFSRSRRKIVAAARGDVMYRLREDGFSTTQIGRWLGRDHTSVIHAIQKRRGTLSTGLARRVR